MSFSSCADKITPRGFNLYQEYMILTRIKPVFKEIYDMIPLTAGGSQPMLLTNYNKISQLLNIVKGLVAESDKVSPKELQCQGVIAEIETNISKFGEYVPHLTSSMAPTYQAYIPQLQEFLQNSMVLIDKAIDLTSKSQADSLKSCPPINLEQIPNAHLEVALASTLTSLMIDLIFIISAEQIKESQYATNIKEWIDHITKSIVAIFANINQPSHIIINNIRVLSWIKPSIISILSLIESTCPNMDDFLYASVHAITLQQLYYTLETTDTVNSTIEIVRQIGLSYANKQQMKNFIPSLKAILAIVGTRIEEGSFIYSGSSIKATYSTLIGVMEIFEKESYESQAIIAYTICRLYALTIGSFNGGDMILSKISTEISEILKKIFEEELNSVALIQKAYSTNLSSFDEKVLGQLSYHVSQLNSIQKIDPSSNFFIETIRRAHDSIGSLPMVILRVIDKCTNNKIQTIFQNEHSNLLTNAECFTKWTSELLLTLSTNVQLRVEAASNTLSYLQTLKIDLPNGIPTILSNINGLMQSTPQYILMGFSDVNKLLENLNIIRQNSTAILTKLSEYEQTKIYTLLSLLVKAFKIYTSDFISCANQLTNYIMFQEVEDLVSSLTSLSTQIVPMITEASIKFKQSQESFYYFFSKPYSGINTICSIIQKYPNLAGTLINFPTTAKTILEVVWPIAAEVAQKIPTADTNNLLMYTNTLPKKLTDLSTTLLTMPQPQENVNIPEELRELTKLEQSSQKLSPQLKYYAQILLGWVKDGKTQNALPLVKQWFKAVINPSNDYNDACQKFLLSLWKLLSKSSDTNQFLDSFCYFSVSMGKHENAFGEQYTEFVKKRHTSIYNSVHTLLNGEKHLTRFGLKVISDLVQIMSITVVQSINQLLTLFYIAELNNQSEKSSINNDTFKPILTAIMNKKETQELTTSIISKISQRLWELSPNLYTKLTKMTEADIVCDEIYDRVEIFRSVGNNILKQSNIKEAQQEELIKYLKSYIISSLEAGELSYHSIQLRNLKNTTLTNSFVESYSKIFSTLYNFSSTTLTILTNTESLNMKLRMQNRSIARELDNFINYSENPPKPESPEPGFKTLMQTLFVTLSTLMIHISRTIISATKSIVNEMYEQKDKTIQTDLNESIKEFENISTTIRSKAFGPLAMDFSTNIVQIDSTLKQFVNNSINLDFKNELPVITLLQHIQTIGESSLRLCQIAPTIIDKSVGPDQISADKIPNKFELPIMPEINLIPIDAYQELMEEKPTYEGLIDTYKKTFNNTESQNEELVEITLKLFNGSKTFVNLLLQVVVSSYDKHLQIQLQTEIHTYVTNINNILQSTKDFLLRKSNYEENLNESIEVFVTQIPKLISLAEQISKVEEPANNNEVDEEEKDEVTRELAATSRAIEEMTTRLANFGNQINIEDNEDDEDNYQEEEVGEDVNIDDSTNDTERITNIEAEQGTLPAFVISHATPILQNTSLILKRAQEITQKIIENVGHIQNEKLIIKVAQDLSESAELLLITAEILIQGTEKEAEYKVVTAAKIIKASISSLVTQVLANGGDSEGIMNNYVRNVAIHTNKIIRKATKIIKEGYAVEEAKQPKRVTANAMIGRLNIQNKINQYQKLLLDEEAQLKQFRKRF
ncbi:hypothetical protein GPJ56_008446 [Histomonas meleagridis]|uniref:uncharacterized protein n=1 Tax=Histomonas meleagridis TaxID=135588 RepID=UPI00355A4877|nr:hypothetical protein GPJ56_008446 [Histomonas meleagridis]KAH0806502.1 hypothetical protein GO595_000664 [Histomonas meleagridis]